MQHLRQMRDRAVTRRQCGSCTVCCEGWLTSEVIDMKPGSPCTHCTETGCSIYADRPENPCVTFECGWLVDGSPLPEQLRPDRCGAIVLLNRKWNRWKVVMAIATGEEIPAATLDWLQAYARDNRIPLLFHKRLVENGKFTGRKDFGYGPPAFIKAVKTAVSAEDIFTVDRQS